MPVMFQVMHLCRQGLSDISFTLDENERVGLSGPSGSGKTLLLRALADLDPNTGQVLLDGVDRNDMPPTDWRRRVGMLPADSRWWAATVGEHMGSVNETWFEALGFGMDVLEWKVERLSSGERQRLALLRLLANRPRVLLLDEPTANLDPDNIARVEGLVSDYQAASGAACLWVTHSRDQAQRISARFLYMDGGRLHEEAVAA